MLKEHSVDNWILAGTGFLLLFAVGCFFWFQNEMAHLQPQQLEKSTETIQIEVRDTIQQDPADEERPISEVASKVSSTRKNSQRIHKQQSARGLLHLKIML